MRNFSSELLALQDILRFANRERADVLPRIIVEWKANVIDANRAQSVSFTKFLIIDPNCERLKFKHQLLLVHQRRREGSLSSRTESIAFQVIPPEVKGRSTVLGC